MMSQLSQEREAILRAALAEARRVTFNEKGLPVVDGRELPVINGHGYARRIQEAATYFGEDMPQAFLPIPAEADRERAKFLSLSHGGGIWERDGFAETAALRGE